jgi:uncharacterized membrane protein YidH (DUF202 family)
MSSNFAKQVKETQNSFIVKSSSTYEASFVTNLIATILLAYIATLAGALVDNQIAKWQGENGSTKDRKTCFGYFSLQLIFDIVILILLARLYQPFIPWLQLTVAGIFSGVLFFTVQERLSVNALCTVKN